MKHDLDRETRTACCANRLLSTQPDFIAQRSLLEETAQKHGAECMFLPVSFTASSITLVRLSFGLAFSYVTEYRWGYGKRLYRAKSDGTAATMEKLVHELLQSCPGLHTIRRWAERMWKMLTLYSNDSVDGPLAAFLIKKYSSHRSVPTFVGDELDKLREEYESKQLS